jgi:uncharacterized protein
MMQLDLDERVVFFNKFSGALAIAKKDWITSRAEGEIDEVLHSHSLLLNPESESRYSARIAETLENYRRERGLNFYISPHFDCPMGCQYCFQQNVKSCAEHLDIGHIEKIMDFTAKERERQGIDKVIIVFFGGEPLLPQAFEFNDEMLRAARKRDYMVRIVTSGTTLTDRYLELLREHRPIITDIDITIDGPKDVHNRLRPLKSGAHSFEIIEESVKRLLAHGLPVSAKINVGRDNIGHVDELFATFARLRWTESPFFRVLINFVRDFGGIEVQEQRLTESSAVLRLTSALNKLAPEIRAKVTIDSVKFLSYLAYCLLSKTFFSGEPRAAFCNPDTKTTYSIGPDCSVYSCNWMVGKPEFANGTIFEGTKRGGATIPSPCDACPITTLCGGGCLIERSREGYFETCFDDNVETITDFVRQAAPLMHDSHFLIINREFQWQGDFVAPHS